MVDDSSSHQATPRSLASAYEGTYQVRLLPCDSTTLLGLSGEHGDVGGHHPADCLHTPDCAAL
jgi:hypothetical protein